jgi:transposase
LTAVWSAAAPGWLRELPALRTLQRVWWQQYYAVPLEEPMRWRSAGDLPPAAQMINSPYDVDARYSLKRTTTWTGYKVHLTETCDDDTPHLITHLLTTPATTPDWHAPEPILTALAAKALLPDEHLLDAGYVDSEVIVTSQSEHGVHVIGPVPADTSWQARQGAGFAVACFTLDWETQTATCPRGVPSRTWSPTHDKHGNAVINIDFDAPTCAACPVRQHCTRSAQRPRELTVRPRPQHEALQAARQLQQTPDFKAQYEDRAGIEGTLSQALRVADLRRSRYIGLAKTHLHHVLAAAAINLRRIGDWFADTPRAQSRTAPFVRLAQAAAG